jgi:alpha-1,6-mannosyltransferase
VHVGLAIVYDLAHHVTLALTLLGPAFLWLGQTARRLEGSHAPLTAVILAGAVLLRLPLLPLPLTLSDDALRYVWDGKVAAAGFNPYVLPPDAGTLTFLRDDAWRQLAHRQVPTVYPPLSIAAFSIAARLPFPILAWKGLTTAADLLACALLLALARRLGVPEGRAAWYAWNPLVALESSGMGHLDSLGVAAVLATLLMLTPRSAVHSTLPAPPGPGQPRVRPRVWEAACCAAAAVLVKLVPAAALPMWARQSGRPLRLLAATAVLVGAAFAPVLASTAGPPPGLTRFAVSWDFNGPLFEPLWRLLDAAGAAPALARLLDRCKEWTGWWTLPNPLYPYLYPQMLAKLLLALGMAAAVRRSLGERDPVAGTGRLFGTLLLLSPTVYPWYLLWVLPAAALYRWSAWLALSGLLLLAYLPQHAGAPLWPWTYLAIWLPFGLLLLRSSLPARQERWSSG